MNVGGVMGKINEEFQWKVEPEAEKIVLDTLKEALEKSPTLRKIEEDLKSCSCELIAFLDYAGKPFNKEELQKAGFTYDEVEGRYRQLRAQLPDLVFQESRITIALLVESIEAFLLVRGLNHSIIGKPFSRYRTCQISSENEVDIFVVERRGSIREGNFTFDLETYFECKTLWMTRPRSLEREEEDLEEAARIAKEIVKKVGTDAAAALILSVEREYWLSRNTAGELQKNRQDRVGFGFANHDHHTFRSSRKYFKKLVQLFEIIGFKCRERFYAGSEAGWGAQVMENSSAKFVLFLDVDLAPHEVGIDFAHDQLKDLPTLGTIGLWCALHGESILKAGMHHLEAQFSFDELKDDLQKIGISQMPPFSNFPYLKQAFTHGEKWRVDPKRIELLERSGKITSSQAEMFLVEGAIGSHLENLQRKEGYKGFNQKNVSIIIAETDPREGMA